jgi:hypothetical protein
MLSPSDLRRPLPDNWTLLVGFDTGAFMNCAFGVMPPESLDIFIVQEFPNYRYVAGEPERLDITDPVWAKQIRTAYRSFLPNKTKCRGWVDPNSQFKAELKNYGLMLIGNKRHLELRVEITREYLQNGHLHFAPWLSIIPYEFERAVWPEEHTNAGQFLRLKQYDHGLDCVEHICSRRPRMRQMVEPRRESFIERHLREHRYVRSSVVDPHLGRTG